jgi:hypothetical protein
MFEEGEIRKILYRNSDLLFKNNLKTDTILRVNQLESGLSLNGGKQLNVSYKNNKYIFNESIIDENHYILSTKNEEECVNVIISKEEKVAEIHGLKSYKSCLVDTNQNVGSELMKLTLKLLNKYKDKFNIDIIVLTDNSVKNCNGENIKLSIMYSLMNGDTWYGKYNFRPIKVENNFYKIDDYQNELYEKNKVIMRNIKISNINLIDYVKLSNNEKLINATQKLIQEKPLMFLKDYIFNLLTYYDKTCESFIKFYEQLYNRIAVFYPYHKLYGLKIKN